MDIASGFGSDAPSVAAGRPSRDSISRACAVPGDSPHQNPGSPVGRTLARAANTLDRDVSTSEAREGSEALFNPVECRANHLAVIVVWERVAESSTELNVILCVRAVAEPAVHVGQIEVQ